MILKKIKAYHGTTRFIDEFNLNFLNGGEHQDGIGIYFTLKKQHTEYYSGVNGNVYEVELSPQKILNQKDIIKNDLIFNLIKHSPYLEEIFNDFVDITQKGMTKERAIKEVRSFYQNMEAKTFLKTFSNDIYKDKYKEFVENLNKFGNYDLMTINFNEVKNIVVFNPKIIKIKKNLNLKAEKEYQIKKEKEIIKNEKLKDFFINYKNREEILSDVAFHGSNFLKLNEKNLKTGGDGLFWTANNPQIAQNYISPYSSIVYNLDIEKEDIINDNYKKLYPFNLINIEKLELMGYSIEGDKNKFNTYDNYKIFKYDNVNDKNIKTQVSIPTEKDFQLFLSQYGYFFSGNNKNIKVKFKFDENGNKILINNNIIEDGRLAILKGISKLKILDVSNNEGDLNIKQYTNYELFEKLDSLGYDGIKINDFTNSEYYGNFEHFSIGLTKERLKKVKTLVIDVKRFEWDNIKTDILETKDININKIIEEKVNNRNILYKEFSPIL